MARVGLVLGSGGIVGASYLTGALEAIRRSTGWEPHHAEVIIGTSAGSFIGTLALGFPLWGVYGWCTGDFADDVALSPELATLAQRMDRHNQGSWLKRFAPSLRLPRPALASPKVVWNALRAPWRAKAESLATALMGEGLFSTRTISDIIRTIHPHGWPSDQLWIPAYDLKSGERVLFRRQDHPDLDVHRAVAASSAIPGVFSPVTIAGRRYVDGGAWSYSNLDLAAGLGLDAVLCLNPWSGDFTTAAGDPRSSQPVLQWLDRQSRQRVNAHLARERDLVEDAGTPVHLFQPHARLCQEASILQSMDMTKRAVIMRQALATTGETLQQEQSAWLLDLLRQDARSRDEAVPDAVASTLGVRAV